MKTFATVCSGIGAPEVAASRLGWKCLFSSEIEPFPNAVREHHFPGVPNYGDMTKYHEWPVSIPDVLIAGTPCQAFSIAGLRKGMADPRGNLTLTFLRIIERYSPRLVLWENVPGVLSDKTGAFTTFLGGLAELGYGFAYRILDAQFFGVAQRRRRVFVVAHSGGQWQRAAAVLFERESLCGNYPPRRETRKDVAPTIGARSKGGGGFGTDAECDGALISSHEVSQPLLAKPNSSHRADAESYVAHSLRADGFDASEDGTGRGTPLAIAPLTGSPYADNESQETKLIPEISSAVTSKWAKGSGGPSGDECQNLTIAFPARMSATQCAKTEELSPAIGANNPIGVTQSMAVRRLTPRECERLQGFPDDYTKLPQKLLFKLGIEPNPENPKHWIADGPRCRALGDSMAVPVIEWILRRVDLVDELVI